MRCARSAWSEATAWPDQRRRTCARGVRKTFHTIASGVAAKISRISVRRSLLRADRKDWEVILAWLMMTVEVEVKGLMSV